MTPEEATVFLHRSMSLCATLGMRAEVFTAHEVTLSLDWSPDLLTSGGALHGGALMALADSAGGACAFLNLPDGATGTSTIESKTNFLGGVREGTVRATSRPLHRGGMTIVIETEIRAGDKLVGKTTQTQAVLRPRT
jgi:1,4-dihydroxy-2-naphthoyl-CoA hydrolase